MSDHKADNLALLRAVVLLSEGKRSEALAELAACNPDPPLDVAAWLMQASLLGRTEVEKCWALYSRALKEYPQHPVVNLRAGVFAYERGDMERAKNLLERSWLSGPNAEAGVYLGRLHAARGDYERACTLLAQAACLEREGGHWREAALREILECSSRIGGL